jgi:Mrp family chromosome partitioning ATPase
MRNLMSELESEADVVVVDTPPILPVSDAIPLLGEVSGVLLVGRLEHTTRDAFWRAARVIASAQGTVLGVVATGVPDDFGERYGAGQYPASQPEGTEAPAAAPARSSS